jgi:hypothetical protein
MLHALKPCSHDLTKGKLAPEEQREASSRSPRTLSRRAGSAILFPERASADPNRCLLQRRSVISERLVKRLIFRTMAASSAPAGAADRVLVALIADEVRGAMDPEMLNTVPTGRT